MTKKRDERGRFLPDAKVNHRLRNSLYGCAFGDALGYPIEFTHDTKRLRRGFDAVRRGLLGIDKTNNGVRVSDDTQMSLYLASALSHRWPVQDTDLGRLDLIHHITDAYATWHDDPENDRAPGGTCMMATHRLVQGIPWMLATVRNSKGNGANMRCGWLGTLELPIDTICGIAQVQAAITHGHPTAIVAAELTAVAAWYLSRGAGIYRTLEYLWTYVMTNRTVYREEWLGNMWRDGQAPNPQRWIARGWDEMQEMLLKIYRTTEATPVRTYVDVTKTFRNTGAADDALGAALLAMWAGEGSMVTALRMAICHDGDSDSVGAIAGTLLGASGVIFDPSWYVNVEHTYGRMIETAVERLS